MPGTHARVEGGMSKKKSLVVVTGINVLFEVKENVSLKKNYIVNLAVSSF